MSPCDYSKYPANWKTEIRPRILARAEHCCEWCGVPNHALIRRSTGNGARYRLLSWFSAPGELQQACRDHPACSMWRKPIVVILTIAHLDHDTTNNDEANLAALCQRCHLRYDAPMKAARRRAKV